MGGGALGELLTINFFNKDINLKYLEQKSQILQFKRLIKKHIDLNDGIKKPRPIMIVAKKC